MAKLLFRQHDPAPIAAAIEELLRQETGATTPLSYQLEDLQRVSREVALGEFVHAALGGKRQGIVLSTIHFSLTQPRRGDLWVQIGKQGIGSYAAPLLYVLELVGAIAGEATLASAEGRWSGGDVALCARLNAHPDLLKSAKTMLRPRWTISGATVSIDPLIKLRQHDNHALLLIYTLPRTTNLGFGSALDADRALALADLLDGII